MPEYSETGFQQLCQLLTTTWVGNLISKEAAIRLHKDGYVSVSNGYYFLTAMGINTLFSLGVLRPDVTFKLNEDEN